MGSTNFNAPPFKLTLTAIGAVVALHVLAAVALTMASTPEPVVKPIETTLPIEIQLVKLPAGIEESEIEAEEMAPTEALKPQPKSATEPELKPQASPQIIKTAQPKVKPKPPIKALAKSTPEKSVPIKPATKTIKTKTKTQPDTPKAGNNEPFRHEIKRQQSMSTIQADDLIDTNERKMLAAQAEKAAQQAHVKAMRDAQAAEDAKAARAAQAVANAKAAQKLKADAESKAAKEAEAATAANNTPVNFTANNASWASSPNFSFPDRAKRGARSGDIFNVVLLLRVNKQGGIDSVSVAQSSGNATLDREAQRQVRSGRFKPFMKNGVPVVGNVTLPIDYAVL
ncbi:energy transducer TonB [Psychrobacter sp. LV10R520-6]|uniref:energy transducer TonB n=1 Tax=Psychrobacter sp. LV10R520-6 TaxID=1415574 RepID=UPI0024CCF0AB|nr:energy transducer TonB [Psychrobacter sp. LV10R520-6]SNT70352.1 protein TonB [Psychrobacter sp. LV10R520-6]